MVSRDESLLISCYESLMMSTLRGLNERDKSSISGLCSNDSFFYTGSLISIFRRLSQYTYVFLFTESSDRRKESKDSVPELAEPSGDQQDDDDEAR